MKSTQSKFATLIPVALLALSTIIYQPSTLLAQGTAFTYQGLLTVNGSPANGPYDLTFAIFSASNGVSQVGATVTNSPTATSNGLFTVTLDFGPSIFTGPVRWLEIASRPTGSPAGFATLAARQELTPAPYAIYAANAGTATGVVASAVSAPQLNTAGGPSPGQVLSYNGTNLVWITAGASGSSSSNAWLLGGNGGTKGANFLGTTDNHPLELRVNNARALLLELGTFSASNAPNVIGGMMGNFVAFPSVGATIGGGGALNYGADPPDPGVSYTNSVISDFGTVGGGAKNTSGFYGTVGGGEANTSIAPHATVGGGALNHSSGSSATVGGGQGNTSSGLAAIVGGGNGNSSSGDYSTVGGGQGNASSGDYSIVGGGQGNAASENWATVGGGQQNVAGWGYSTVGGGSNNTVYGSFSTIIGGINNSIEYGSGVATILGGSGNTALGQGVCVAGRNAHATHSGCFVWGDGTQPANSTGINRFEVLATGGANFYTGGAAAKVFGPWFVAEGLGGEQAYLGGDGIGGDVQIGSLNPLVSTVAVYNPNLSGGFMDLIVRTITIQGGADVAEPFQVSGGELPKGSVVVIDEEHPGQLRLSHQAYDQRVAGIVSGANGINPGISLSQQGLAEGGQNVALSGRVYVLADASSGPIKPGDLLTTSKTRGHAMRAADYTKAQGAILGKAMSALQEGKGMVLVLVTLQ